MKSKKTLMIIACLSLFLIMAISLSAKAIGETGNAILAALAPLIVVIITPLFSRLFKKLGIDIADSQIEPVLMRIIEIIISVEKSKTGLTGVEKKATVTDMAKTLLTEKEKNLLIKKYGTLETAVQAAFERSSVAK